MAAALPIIASIATIAGTGYGVYRQKRASDIAKSSQAATQASLKSLAPSVPAGPSAADIEAQRKAEDAKKAKAAADARAADLENKMKKEAEDKAKQQKSIIGLTSTIRTSASGLTGKPKTEYKSLLGEGGAY